LTFKNKDKKEELYMEILFNTIEDKLKRGVYIFKNEEILFAKKDNE
jgi:hypothetical protein